MKSTFFLAVFLFLSIFSATAQMGMMQIAKSGDSLILEISTRPGNEHRSEAAYVISQQRTLKAPQLKQESPGDNTPYPHVSQNVGEGVCTQFEPVAVGGNVKNSGEYARRQGMTLMAAIVRAGGFSKTADPSRVKLVRADKETIYDLRKVNPDGSNNPLLMDGDEVVVPALSATPKRARLGLLKPGDSVVLRVKSADNDMLEIATAYTISDQGMIRMPMLGKEIPAKGISSVALTIKINEAYKAAGVSAVVELADRESTICNQVITVSGGVTKPGEYLLRPGMTVFAAISRAGGFSDGFSSKVKKVKILRDQKELIFDLRKINPDGSNNPILMDGDQVIVPAG